MQIRWIHRLLLLSLSAVIILPSEEDGAFDLAFLDLGKKEIHHLAKRILKKENKSEFQTQLEDQNFGIFLRSRYDFLDLVFSGIFQFSKHEIHFYTRKFFASTVQYSYLLSSLLLNLPPPIV
ncbi:hypothetical protein EHQ12_07145 [Leptospira gomenensis]|uniref:Uncharacterized protein n=1 Tax=Leptospira gomenensis TaxID=2484974 RepID=A0A5F1YCU9_9LEPT|nr:hypothetical protein [Leptospira gomenensis]TGK35599.1 hypothetical protein EHQ17_06170 [Leptospira gomenensis]TGK40593.1 hypothetical protein EHQ12_07145 [Leptospira gomenensis]TGK46365.1 hypothetical protein EHQ07_06315 [Leptospira gomenensis]TGK65545.1 hypothetical protein EHQ13_04965 [Leptospira gomenensis]